MEGHGWIISMVGYMAYVSYHHLQPYQVYKCQSVHESSPESRFYTDPMMHSWTCCSSSYPGIDMIACTILCCDDHFPFPLSVSVFRFHFPFPFSFSVSSVYSCPFYTDPMMHSWTCCSSSYPGIDMIACTILCCDDHFPFPLSVSVFRFHFPFPFSFSVSSVYSCPERTSLDGLVFHLNAGPLT